MNNALIQNWNNTVAPTDNVYHLGDFCFGSLDENNEPKHLCWERRLNGKITHIKGNHDPASVSIITHAMIEMQNHTVLLVHVPPTNSIEVPEFADFVLCGHVHNAWRHRWLGDKMLINVGVDVWNYAPVSETEIIRYWKQYRKETTKVQITN
jgi:calcineurin-like phosphoesterase family protein